MTKNNLATLLVTVVTVVWLSPSSVKAVSTPSFPSCSNPTGELKANYASGLHGIPGKSAEHYGSDAVYSLNAEMLIQCFCPDSGSTGIKTDWWKISELSDSDRRILEKSGWEFVPNGSLWGLENEPYLAFNSDYTCKNTGGGSNSGGGSSSNNDNGTGGGNVLGSVTSLPQILGLADTSSEPQQLAVFGAIATSAFATLIFLSKRA